MDLVRIESLADLAEAFKETEKVEPEPCNGQIYRYVQEAWTGVSDRDINFRHRFRWLKSKSCNDEECMQCNCLLDDFDEQYSHLGYQLIDFDAILPHGGPVVGKLYKLQLVDWSTDWETGIMDDWTIGFEEYIEPSS